MPAAILTQDLSKQFPKHPGWRGIWSPGELAPPAVDRVSLAVKTGEIFGLVGPNGAGKTTLIKLLSTLIIPTAGTAAVNGYPLEQAEQIKRSIGLVTSDERSFYWRLTGRQNLSFFASLQGLPPEAIPKRVDLVLRQMNLGEVADRRFQTYSSGMRQRLSIARALLNQPRLLFLDEPTKGLDPTAAHQLHRLIRDELVQGENLTVFLTTHWLAEAESLCDRIAVIQTGRLRALGTLPELHAALAPPDRYRLQVWGVDGDLAESLREIGEDIQLTPLADRRGSLEVDLPADPLTLNQTLDLIRERGGKIEELTRTPISLETIFQRSTADPEGQIEPAGCGEPPQGSASGVPSAPSIEAAKPFFPEPAGRGIGGKLQIARAFLRRDARTELSYRFSVLLQLLGVLFTIAIFYFVAELFGAAAAPFLEPYGGDYFSFVLIGIAFAGYFGVGLNSFASSLRDAQTTGTLEAMLTTSTGVSTIIVSSSLWSYLLTTLRVLVYLGVGVIFLGVDLSQGNLPAAILILILTVISFSSLGILAASFIMVLKRGDPVTWAFGAFSTLLGGVYYPIAVLPEWMQVLSLLIPVTYALRGMRLALLQGASFQQLLPEILALTVFCVVLVPLSLAAFRYAVRRARVDGSLTHY